VANTTPSVDELASSSTVKREELEPGVAKLTVYGFVVIQHPVHGRNSQGVQFMVVADQGDDIEKRGRHC
jgi:hypothetical protein